jgi:hypothetical protein
MLVMNLLTPSWDAEIDAGGAVLRATRLAAHAGARRLAANLYEHQLAVITDTGLRLLPREPPIQAP